MAPVEKPPHEPLEGLRSVRGHDAARDFLRQAIGSRRLSTALLFEGPDGVGKERCALALAQCVTCSAVREDGDACGRCASCRAIDGGRAVDILILARDIDVLTQQPQSASDAKTQITIDKVRTLQSERLSYLPHGTVRWVIVRDAHELNPAASNALLKTLEEPPANTHFALLTHRPSELLITVRSRCQRVRFGRLSDEQVSETLQARRVDPAVAAEAARWADGSVGRAVTMADPELLASRRGWLEKLLSALRAGRPGAIVEVSDALSKHGTAQGEEELDAILTMLERYFRDEAIANAEDGRKAMTFAGRSQLVRQTLASLDRNLKAQMAIESLLIRLREAR
jgi:DNA polymerase-3 subunit delta'